MPEIDAARPGARERLLQSGTELIAELGVEGVNTNVIARHAGVGVGTFYVHFEDKRSLHRAAVLRGLERMQEDVGRAAAQMSGRRIVDQVRATVTAAVGFAESEPALFKVAFGAKPPPAAKGQPAMGFSSRATELGLRGLQASGELDMALDPAVAARGFLGMQNAVLLWWIDERERPARERVIETLTRLHPALQSGHPHEL